MDRDEMQLPGEGPGDGQAADAPAPGASAEGVRFEAEGRTWIARPAGTGAAGWGNRGVAPIEAVHFYVPGEARPRFEALVGRGRFGQLHDAELAELLRRATAVPPAG